MLPEGQKTHGRDIGKKPDDGLFYLTKCKDCDREAYVLKYKLTNPRYTGLCRECSYKSKTGDKNLWWKGGTWITSWGYKMVLVPRDDFFRPMADRHGYIREHRLVMAKHLGRCLHSWESVHHKNGDKLNNALSNLDLTTKNQHSSDHSRGYKDGFIKGLQDGKKEALRKLVEWLDQDCKEHGHDVFNSSNRRYCHWCQDDLHKEAGL